MKIMPRVMVSFLNKLTKSFIICVITSSSMVLLCSNWVLTSGNHLSVCNGLGWSQSQTNKAVWQGLEAVLWARKRELHSVATTYQLVQKKSSSCQPQALPGVQQRISLNRRVLQHFDFLSCNKTAFSPPWKKRKAVLIVMASHWPLRLL